MKHTGIIHALPWVLSERRQVHRSTPQFTDGKLWDSKASLWWRSEPYCPWKKGVYLGLSGKWCQETSWDDRNVLS